MVSLTHPSPDRSFRPRLTSRRNTDVAGHSRLPLPISSVDCASGLMHTVPNHASVISTSRRRATRRPRAALAAVLACLCGVIATAEVSAQASQGSAGADQYTPLLAEAFPAGTPEAADGRELFTAVLGSPAFAHQSAGPFEVYVKAGKSPANTEKLLKSAVDGLAPAAEVAARSWRPRDGGPGVNSGRSHPIVLCETGSDYDLVLALLDHCEDLKYSGWKPQNALWTSENRHAEVARTWEVQVFNLSHPVITARSKEWFEHGLGYYALAHLVNRAVRQGAWGQSPPWFDQGLIDELDISAYGKAWVGGEAWSSETAGWFRPGWSGFLPTGASPPPQPSGPPLELATTIKRTGNAWDDRVNSAARHWNELSQDRKSEAPASFAYMAQHQSFLPRDRAYARCAQHLLLASSAASEGGSLLARLDQPSTEQPDGMLSAEPLTVLVAGALGGVPEVDRLEAAPLVEVLSEIRHDEIADRMRALDGAGLLALSDHREQSRWLYSRWKGSMQARTELFRLIMEAEYFQQLYEWDLIGQQLDRGMDAALNARKTFPRSEADLAKVLEAFRGSLEKRAPSVAEGKPGSRDR